MRRSSSSPVLSETVQSLPDPSLSILSMAQTTAQKEMFAKYHSNTTAAPSSSSWNPLVRWIENPLCLEALAVYTLSANAGMSSAEWHGVSMSVLRRSGEWHNIVSYPNIRPCISYIKQFISELEIARAQLAEHSARGVEWFLLTQLALARGKPFMRDLQFVLATPAQIALVISPTIPTFVKEQRGRKLGDAQRSSG